MSYADHTFGDPNAAKRWLQRRRLASAVAAGASGADPRTICDFGAGNGELCKLLGERFRQARIVCYEPVPYLLSEARQNLAALGDRVDFRDDPGSLGTGEFDAVYCLEVFEHLPPEETAAALATVARILGERGRAVIGVPVETGLPALYKGLFRMARRRGAFDATPGNVLRAVAGRPPRERPVTELAPGVRFHLDHLGFDHRRFECLLGERFDLRERLTSPFGLPGAWLMPEINFVVAAKPAP